MNKNKMIRNLVLILILLIPAAAIANTAPHVIENNIDCGACHWVSASTPPPWLSITLPNAQDNTINNRRCYACHDKDNVQTGAVKAQTHSAISTGSQYWTTEGGWSTQCTDCHDPHNQVQTQTWKSLSYVAASASPPSVGSYDTFTNTTRLTLSPGLTDDYYGYYILPDRNYTYYYKIVKWSSVDNTHVDVRGKVNSSYVRTGGYAVVFGKNIKTYVTYANPAGQAAGQIVKLFRPGGANSMVDPANEATSLCVACHTKTKHMRADWATSAPDQWHGSVNWSSGESCMTSSCHAQHEKGFQTSCGSCHGQPPVDAATMVSTIGKTGSTTPGAHNMHNTLGIGCDSCHHDSVGVGAKHNAGRITLGFYPFNGKSQGGDYSGQFGVQYDTTDTDPATTARNNEGAKKCSNVYCHGATMAFKGGTNNTPTWDSASTGACGTCHAAIASGTWGSVNTVPTLGSHVKHAANWGSGLGLACSKCHPAVTDGTHVKGAIAWKLDATDPKYGPSARYNGVTTGSKGPAPSASYSACTNIYCHSTAQGDWGSAAATYAAPVWGSSGSAACGSCHNTATTSPWLSSGSHSLHFDANKTDCDYCHYGAGEGTTLHVNRNIDVIVSPSLGGSYSQMGASANPPGNGYGTCSAPNSACHASPSSYQWGAAAGALGCAGCHKKNNTLAGVHGKHYGSAIDSTWRTTLNRSTASTYIFECGVCHNVDPVSKHNNGRVSTFQRADVIFDANVAGGGTYAAGAYQGVDSYDWTAGTCSATYCHSDGNGNKVAVSNWATPTNSRGCAGCHNYTAASGVWMTSGKHTKHVKSYTFNCEMCHNGTANTAGSTNLWGSIVDKSKHVNKVNDVTVDNSWGSLRVAGAWTASSKTCSANYCHSNANPMWNSIAEKQEPNSWKTVSWGDAAMNCYSCHKGTIEKDWLTIAKWGSSGNWGGADVNVMSSDGHHRLVGPQWIRKFPCYYCHADTVDANGNIKDFDKHVNGVKEIKIAPQWWATSSSRVIPPPSFDDSVSCANVYCHTDGTTNPPDVRVFRWFDSRKNCNSCHGHEQGSCSTTNCHDGASHDDGWHTMKTDWVTGEQWKEASPMFANEGAGAARANSHPRHMELNYNCDQCHFKTVKGGTCVAAGCHGAGEVPAGGMGEVGHIDPAYHVNKQRDIFFDPAVNPDATYNPATKTCSSLTCHGATTPQWGSNGLTVAGCNTCHKANNSLAGKHATHYDSANAATARTFANSSTVTKYIFDCGVCHVNDTPPHKTLSTAVVAFYTTFTDAGTYTAGGSVLSDSYNYTNGTCSATYCHSDGNGNTVTASNWATNTRSLGCAGCHNYDTASGVWMTSGKHTKHVKSYSYDCSKCHSATAFWGSIVDKTKHVNKSKDVAFDSWNSLGAWSDDSRPKTCETTYCHSDGTSVATLAAQPPSTPSNAVTWTTVLSCTGCHGNEAGNNGTGKPSYSSGSPKANNHGKHTDDCSFCHSSTATTSYTTIGGIAGVSITGFSNHANKVYNVGQKDGYTTFAYWFTTPQTGRMSGCTNISCHYGGDATYGSTLTCAACHSSLSGAHSQHAGTDPNSWYTYGDTANNSTATVHMFSCGNCHPLNSSKHANGVVDMELYNAAAADGTMKKLNPSTAFTTFSGSNAFCGNVYCHSNGADPMNLVYRNTPAWGTVMGANKCGQCHDNPPQFSPVVASGTATGGSSTTLIDSANGWGTPNWSGATIRIEDGKGAGLTNMIVSNTTTQLNLNAAWSTLPDSTTKYSIFMGQSHYVSGSLMGGEGGHLVGIHADNIYSGTVGIAGFGKWSTSGHGNPATSTTITCYVCHSGEVSWTTVDTYSLYNVASSRFKCSNASCHGSGAEYPLQNALITNKSLHVNGTRDVSIATGLIVKSKAQLRSGSVPVMWNRVGIYKDAGSYDWTTGVGPSNWNPATKTCATACHNNNSITWGESTVSCITCHNQTK